MKLQKLLTLLLLSVKNSDGEGYHGCVEVEKKFHPQRCCKLPIPSVPTNIYNDCEEKCKADQQSQACCSIECIEGKFQLNHDGKISSENALAAFAADMEARNISRTDWQSTFKHSIAACGKISPLMIEMKCGNETFEYHSRPIVSCILQMNFMDCPATSYTTSAECDAMKAAVKTIDTCGDKFGDTFVLNMKLFLLRDTEAKAGD